MEAAAVLSERSTATCCRCKAEVAVEHARELWSKDPVDLYAQHTREESSFYPGEGGNPLRVVRRVRCAGSGEEVVR